MRCLFTVIAPCLNPEKRCLFTVMPSLNHQEEQGGLIASWCQEEQGSLIASWCQEEQQEGYPPG